MKNKLVVLLTLLAVPSVAFAENGVYVWIDGNFRHWLYPIAFYTLIFSIFFMGLQLCLYIKYRARVNDIIMRFIQFLKVRPTLAVIFCGITVSSILGILTRIALPSDASNFLGGLYPMFVQFFPIAFLIFEIILIILFACGRFRNKVLLAPSFMKVVLSIIISVICANLLYLILTEIGVLRLVHLSWTRGLSIYLEREGIYLDYEGLDQPINNIIWIWWFGILYVVTVPFSLLLLWIGNAYRWLKSKREQRVAFHKCD